MPKACLVCCALHLETINIFLHPRMNIILRLLLGLQTTSNDYICPTCCHKIINSFDSELNCQLEWNLKIPKVFKKEIKFESVKVDVASTLSKSNVNIEPKSPNEENFGNLEKELRGKVENVEYCFESYTNGNNGTKRRRLDFKRELKAETPDADLSQNESCMEFFKRDTSVDLEQQQTIQEIGARRVQSCAQGKLFPSIWAFTALSSPNLHKDIYTEERPHECYECGKCFATLSSLNSHKVIHTEERFFKSLDYGKCYTDSSSLTRHKGLHLGEFYSCNYYPKTFGLGYNDQVHLPSYTKEKPPFCSECGQTFPRPSTLNHHKKTHNRKRPFIGE